jgi:hypothetical protein
LSEFPIMMFHRVSIKSTFLWAIRVQLRIHLHLYRVKHLRRLNIRIPHP